MPAEIHTSQRRPRQKLKPLGEGFSTKILSVHAMRHSRGFQPPHLLKQEQLQLAGASFRDQHFSWTPKSIPPNFPANVIHPMSNPMTIPLPFSPKHLSGRPSASDAAEVTGRTFFVLAYHVAAGRELLDAGHFSKQADFGLGAQGDKAAEGTMSRQPI